MLDLEKQLDELLQSSKDSDLDFSQEIKAIEKKIDITKRMSLLGSYLLQKVQLSGILIDLFADYISRILRFQPPHGDRLYKEMPPLLGTSNFKRTKRDGPWAAKR